MIKKWHLKAIVQKSIAIFPNRHQLNWLFQKYVTRGLVLDRDHFMLKFSHGVDHVQHYLQEKGVDDLQGVQCLEIGSGWYPIVPICYYLTGAAHTHSYDISSLSTPYSVRLTMQKFVEYEAEVKRALPAIQESRWQALRQLALQGPQDPAQLADLCQAIQLTLKVQDARHTGLPDQSIDLISSNNTFEHVDPAVLEGILREFWRVLRSGGLMSHFIDMSDHFAHMDKSISIYNYLQFTEQQWQWIDNRIQPQNRWRLPQYQQLYQNLQIPYRSEKLRAGDTQLLAGLDLKPPFSAMNPAEVAISHGYLLSSKTASRSHQPASGGTGSSRV